MAIYTDATLQQVDGALQQALAAFALYKKKNGKERGQFLHAIAAELQKYEAELLQVAARETHLEEARLKVELKRTIFQLTNYGQACERGTWLDVRIDTADAGRVPARPDLRKMMVPLGPVVVFGASNFPFAYSTAGGDTACALAAGCPVIVKAHPAHAETSALSAQIIQKAAQQCGMPQNVFIHLYGASFEVGKALVMHPYTKAVGFTGSFAGGKALFDWAASRPVPIPVFAEMGSVNPVFILQKKLAENVAAVAEMYAQSITTSVGQFCTNPGIMVGISGYHLDAFKMELGKRIEQIRPAVMLHDGIAKSFHLKRAEALQQKGVEVIAVSQFANNETEGLPTIAATSADNFLKKPLLHQEIFGPYSILIECKNTGEMLQVALALEGQLTTTLIATNAEVKENSALVEALQNICGRFVLNGVPTGVDVALAMHHGGPFPATTDSRFTAVGADGIKRFARPICFQNWSNELLPDELKDENPLHIWRTVNNELTTKALQ